MEPEKKLIEVFRRQYICTHITALKAFDNFILVAESNQTLLFDWRQKLLLETEVIFQSCSIHGIRKTENFIVFFGAKSIKVYQFNSTSPKKLNKISEEFYLEDWIHDIQWLSQKQTLRHLFAVICAHNSLIIWDVEKGKTKEFQCSENCILYAGSIICGELGAIVIASGTVFNRILLWSPDCIDEHNGKKVPFHNLIGHQGVIFSITYNEKHRLLSSTSDDRSVRLWKVCNDTHSANSIEFWRRADIKIQHILFSHESRVWMSCILKDCILSIGEDSQLCFWDFKGNLLKKKKCHKNGSIWCLETVHVPCNDKEDSYSYMAFTGGSDGGVCIWDIPSVFSSELISQISLYTKEISEVSDFPRITLLIDKLPDNLMMTTDNGNLLSYDMVQKVWNNIFYDGTFASYCVPSISRKNAFLAMGNISGDLVLINLKKQKSETRSTNKVKAHQNKICSVHWVCQTDEYLLTCGIKGQMAFWKVCYVEEEFDLECLLKLFLPKCKNHWWSTAGLYTNTKKCIVVGDRGGSVSLYSSLCNASLQSADIQVNPLMAHRYIHGKNGVTDIQEHDSLIYSSGRDGKVQIYFMSKERLNLLHSIKVSHDLEWIGKMLFYDKDLLLMGFHTKDFIVWSTRLESTVMTVECGGGHRSWDFYINEKGHAVFSAIKKKDIIFYKEDLHHKFTQSVLKAGISGQEFRCCSYLYTKQYSSNDSMSVIACGGEDTTLRIIGILNCENPEFFSICNLSGHLSSIIAIAKVKIVDQNSLMLVSVGGRSQLVVWRINYDCSIQCEQLGTYILSSLNKPFQRKSKNVHIDPQTRLMDVAICYPQTSEAPSSKYLITAACSDGYFRIYTFDTNVKELLSCYNVLHGTNCILKLSPMFIQDSADVFISFVTGATDGFIKIYNPNAVNLHVLELIETENGETTKSIAPVFQMRLHQSGVNALDVKHVSGKTWLICTAGDDNALSVTTISCLKGNSVELISKQHVPNAHASQITGVKILDKNAIVSASIDQRINLWKYNFARDTIIVSLVTSRISLIPDIANLDSWKNETTRQWTLLVCGQGLESFQLSFNKNNEPG